VGLLDAENFACLYFFEAATLDEAVDQQSEMGLELLAFGLAKPISAKPVAAAFFESHLSRFVEREDDVETIRLTRFEPIGVIVQTTFWIETYKKIMARILERFANVQVRNTACIDSLQRLPEVEKLAKEVDAIIIFGWTEGMTTRMIEVARAFNAHVHKIEKVDDLRLD